MKLNIFKFFEKKREAENKQIARLIGEYYLAKHYNSNSRKETYEKANKEIASLGITQIQTKGNTISITLMRPGILIGKRGSNISAFQGFLFNMSKYSHLKIIEDRVIWETVPVDYSADNDWDY